MLRTVALILGLTGPLVGSLPGCGGDSAGDGASSTSNSSGGSTGSGGSTASAGTATGSATDATRGGATGDPVRDEFERHYAGWQAATQIGRHSNIDAYVNHPEFDAMVQMAAPALPYAMEKMAAGDFFMNDIFRQVTGVDVWDQVPLDLQNETYSAQDESALWIEWWAENG